MKTIVCVRHGRTAWNAAGRFQGIADIPLDEIGREQVRETAQTLATRQFSYAVTSDLMRARETMEILIAGRSLSVEVDCGFRERDFGLWEGFTWAQITERTPELAGRISIDVRSFQPEGGEPFDHVKARVDAAFTRVLEKITEEQTALVVAHAGVLHALLDVLYGGDRSAVLIAPAGVLEFRIDATGIALI